MSWLLFAAKNVFRNRRRAFITILITSIGTAAIMTAGGFAIFTYDGLQELSTRDSGHIIIGHQDYFDREEEMPLELGLSDYMMILDKVSTDKRVRKVLPRVSLSGLISNGDKSSIFMGTGIDPEEFVIKGPTISVLDGKRLSRKLDPEKEPEIMVAMDLAKTMKAKIGSYLTLMGTTSDGVLNAIDVQVVGIFSTGVPEVDKRLILTNLNTAQDLLVSEKVSSLHVYLYETSDTDNMLNQVKGFYPDLGYEIWLDQAFFYVKVKDLYNRIFGMLGVIIMVMVFFSVSNTMSMVVIERTREIGTQAAMGTYPWEIIRNFTLESFVIALMGTSIGLLIAGVVSISLQLAGIEMPPPPGRSDGYPLIVNFSPELAMITVPTVIAVCVIAAWAAARRGVKKPIVEALAHV
jgi:putative ABC transport system permease protein